MSKVEAGVSATSEVMLYYGEVTISGVSTGVLVSVSNSCIHYSKRALAPIVSLVTLVFNSVLWLGSKAKSPPGKGTSQRVLYTHHPYLNLSSSFFSPTLLSAFLSFLAPPSPPHTHTCSQKILDSPYFQEKKSDLRF